MSPIEAALWIAAAALSLQWLMGRYLDRLGSPAYLRERGVVIQREEILQRKSAPIGTYRGREIYGTVTFMGMEYRFDRIVPPALREHIGRGELFLEPGLVYKVD